MSQTPRTSPARAIVRRARQCTPGWPHAYKGWALGAALLATALCAVASAVPAQLPAQVPAQAPAQPAAQLARAITGVSDGIVRMTFAARPETCREGDDEDDAGHSGRRCVGRRSYSYSDDVEWDSSCDSGPVRVVLEMHDHLPTRIRTYVGGRWRSPRPGGTPVHDLGVVSAPQAARVLVDFARQLPAHPGSEAIFPAFLADSAEIWPALASLARDASRPEHTREQAVFWMGLAAADVSAGLDSLAEDRRVDEGVREQAVFALSQRPRDEGVPALLRIAQSNRDPTLRRRALFWLGQSGDPRAIDLFERILAK